MSGAENFLRRLRNGDEKTLLIAERLSAKVSQSANDELGRKVTRILIIGTLLGFRFATSDRIFGMLADSRAQKLWSDLKKAVIFYY
jgi:hypothetical protein